MWAETLNYGLTQLFKVLDPDLVVIGGSAAPIYQFVEEKVNDIVDSILIARLPQPKIELSSSGPSGAACTSALFQCQQLTSAFKKSGLL